MPYIRDITVITSIYIYVSVLISINIPVYIIIAYPVVVPAVSDEGRTQRSGRVTTTTRQPHL